jgi:hypothetical protein
MSENSRLQEAHLMEVGHLYGLIGTLREQLIVLSETSRKIVDFQQLQREYDVNHRATKAFILDQALLRFVGSFSADLAANLKTLAELD